MVLGDELLDSPTHAESELVEHLGFELKKTEIVLPELVDTERIKFMDRLRGFKLASEMYATPSPRKINRPTSDNWRKEYPEQSNPDVEATFRKLDKLVEKNARERLRLWEADKETYRIRSNRLTRLLIEQLPDACRSDQLIHDGMYADHEERESDAEDGGGKSNPKSHRRNNRTSLNALHRAGFSVDAQQYMRDVEKDKPLISARAAFIEKSIELNVVPLAKLHRDGVIELAHYRMGDTAAVAFAEVVRRNQVEHLDASYCGIRRRGATALCRNLANKNQLHFLSLAGNAIDRQGAQALAHALQTTRGHSELRTLDIAANGLGDFAITPLLFTIAETLPRLLQLNLSDNRLGGTVTVIDALVKVLTKCSTLAHVDISWNFIKGAAAERIAVPLKKSLKLQELYMQFNSIGELGGIAIGGILHNNKQLRILDLSHNGISQKACIIIADGLKSNENLEMLELNGNSVGREGGRALLRAVSQSPAACRLGIQDCNFQHTDPKMFNPTQASGAYHLNLSDPYERAIAEELLQLARNMARHTNNESMENSKENGEGSSGSEESETESSESEAELDAIAEITNLSSGQDEIEKDTFGGDGEPTELAEVQEELEDEGGEEKQETDEGKEENNGKDLAKSKTTENEEVSTPSIELKRSLTTKFVGSEGKEPVGKRRTKSLKMKRSESSAQVHEELELPWSRHKTELTPKPRMPTRGKSKKRALMLAQMENEDEQASAGDSNARSIGRSLKQIARDSKGSLRSFRKRIAAASGEATGLQRVAVDMDMPNPTQNVLMQNNYSSSALDLHQQQSNGNVRAPVRPINMQMLTSADGRVQGNLHRVSVMMTKDAANSSKRLSSARTSRSSGGSQVRRRTTVVIPTVVQYYSQAHWPWMKVKLDGSTLPHGARDIAFVLPKSGLLEFDFIDVTPRKKTQSDTLRESGFKAVSDLVNEAVTKDRYGNKALHMIEQACEDNYFTTTQAKLLIGALPDPDARVRAVRCMYGRIVDLDTRDTIFEILEPERVAAVQASIGPLCHFNIDNAMGYHRLDLANPEDREVALRLIELNEEQVRKRRKRCHGKLHDLSQSQNWCAFRNLRFWPTSRQRKADLPTPVLSTVPTMVRAKLPYIDFLWMAAWRLPREGVMELDFVIWRPISVHALPLYSEEDVRKEEEEIEQEKIARGENSQSLQENDQSAKSKTTEKTTPPKRNSISKAVEKTEKDVTELNLGEFEESKDGDDDGEFASFRARAANWGKQKTNDAVIAFDRSMYAFDYEFQKFLTALQAHKYAEMKIMYLRVVSSVFYFTTDQVFEIIDVVTKSKYLTLDRRRKTPQFVRDATAVELIVMLWPRMVDQKIFRDRMSTLSNNVVAALSSRIGVLVLFDSHVPDRFHHLDCERPDENLIAAVLVKMAVEEPGENWIEEEYQGRKFDLPMTWTKRVPCRGILTLTYQSPKVVASYKRCWPLREKINKLCSAGDPPSKSYVAPHATKSIVRRAEMLLKANVNAWFVTLLKSVCVRYLRELPPNLRVKAMSKIQKVANIQHVKLHRMMSTLSDDDNNKMPSQNPLADIELSSSSSLQNKGDSKRLSDGLEAGADNAMVRTDSGVGKEEDEEEEDRFIYDEDDSGGESDGSGSSGTIGNMNKSRRRTTLFVVAGELDVLMAPTVIRDNDDDDGDDYLDKKLSDKNTRRSTQLTLPKRRATYVTEPTTRNLLDETQRLFVVMMFQVVDIDMSDSIDLSELMEFAEVNDELTMAENVVVQTVVSHFEREIIARAEQRATKKKLGWAGKDLAVQKKMKEEEEKQKLLKAAAALEMPKTLDREAQRIKLSKLHPSDMCVTLEEWINWWESVVYERGNGALETFVKGFEKRARHVVGDAEFEFTTNALQQANMLNHDFDEFSEHLNSGISSTRHLF